MNDPHLFTAEQAREFLDSYFASLPPAQEGGLAACRISTPLGEMLAIADDRLHLLEFVDTNRLPRELRALGPVGHGRAPLIDRLEEELARHFETGRVSFTIPLAIGGSPFQNRVWQALLDVPAGSTLSYGELSRRLGDPKAVRAVAAANGANVLAILVPCHRIIGADGSLTGYGGGLWRKQRLLEIEGQETPSLFGESA